MSSGATPQFETAEYSGGDRCAVCRNPVGKSYFRLNGAMACPACADRARFEQPKESGGAFVRGLLFGVGGAIVGLTLYAVVGIATGLEIGYVSLAVGFIVAKAMMKGSTGIGGRKYQVTAALLTYAAVAMAQVPIALWQIAHRPKPAATSSATTTTANGAVTTAPVSKPKPMSFGIAILVLAGIGLASPILNLQDPLHGLIGLVILAVGIRIAWQLAAGRPRASLEGPYDNTVPAA